MLPSFTPFPATGALCFRALTAEPARILRHNDDGTVLLERRRKLADGTTTAIPGSSANVTVPLAEVFEHGDIAIHGSKSAAKRAHRARAAGGRA